MTSLNKTAGMFRVIDPEGANPYDALKLNPNIPLKEDEIKIAVTFINLDSTSARQIWEEQDKNSEAFLKRIEQIVHDRGKMHNPITQSGGVLSGIVLERGATRSEEVMIGTPVVTLVSNTLVPLHLEQVLRFDPVSHQIEVKGFAILPPFAKYARIPEGLALSLALTIFDVCGVVPQVERLSQPNSIAVILGASGKAGLLATYTASRSVGPDGLVVGVVPSEAEAELYGEGPKNIRTIVCDARDVTKLEEKIQSATNGRYGDVVIDCTNISGVEIGAAVSCRNGGVVYFFNMATRFQATALGAELVSRDIQYVIGYGLLPNAAEKAVSLVMSEPLLRNRLERISCF